MDSSYIDAHVIGGFYIATLSKSRSDGYSYSRPITYMLAFRQDRYMKIEYGYISYAGGLSTGCTGYE